MYYERRGKGAGADDHSLQAFGTMHGRCDAACGALRHGATHGWGMDAQLPDAVVRASTAPIPIPQSSHPHSLSASGNDYCDADGVELLEQRCCD